MDQVQVSRLLSFQVRRHLVTRCIRICITSRSAQQTGSSALGRRWRGWTGRTAAWSSCREHTPAHCRSTTTPSGRYKHTHTHTPQILQEAWLHTLRGTNTHTPSRVPSGWRKQDVPWSARLQPAAPQGAPGDGEGRHRLLPSAADPRLWHEPDAGLPQGTTLPIVHLVSQPFLKQTSSTLHQLSGCVRLWFLWVTKRQIITTDVMKTGDMQKFIHLKTMVCERVCVCVFPGHLLPLCQRWLLLHRRGGNHTGKHRERGEGDRSQEICYGQRNYLQGQTFTFTVHSLAIYQAYV